MSIEILDGRALADDILHDLHEKILEKNLTPHLAVVLVGDDPASHLYVSLKEKAAKKIGITVSKYELARDVTEQEIIECIDWLNQDQDIDGILVQLPLPEGIDEDNIIQQINSEKDADGFHPETMNNIKNGTTEIRPAPAEAVVRLIVSSSLFHAESNAVVIANNDIFYTPIKLALEEYHCQTAYINPADEHELQEILPEADIVVVAVGRAAYLTGSYIKDDAIVIDVGTNRKNNTVVGDVDVASVKDIAGALSPVPGGVGPMTIACLLENVVTLHIERNKL